MGGGSGGAEKCQSYRKFFLDGHFAIANGHLSSTAPEYQQ